MKRQFQSCIQDETGQDLTEFSLLVAFVVGVVIGLATGFHGSIASIVALSNSQLSQAQSFIH